LKKLLDIMVLVGLICHPTKLKPPAQILIFCGFLYDFVGTPRLRIPYNKVVRALALLEFLMRGSRTVLCHLASAVLVGTLQPVSPANPNDIGPLSYIMFTEIFIMRPLRVLMTFNTSITRNWHWYFSWWEQAFTSGLREQVKPRDFCTLGVARGNGSGVVLLLNEWTQEMEASQRWKPGWGLEMGLFTASLPTGESSES
jgi:hypothetical protein